jgi:tetratricopeptide (TPR) repeat protein
LHNVARGANSSMDRHAGVHDAIIRAAMVSFFLDSSAGRLVAALSIAVAIATQARRGSILLLVALVVAVGGVLQALPWAMRELSFEFNLGRARWGALMSDADVALDRGDTALAAAKLEAALGDARRFPRPVLAAQAAERLADLMLRSDRRVEAEPWLAEALRQRERVPGRDDPRTRATRDRLADLRTSVGDHSGAEQLLRLQVESAGRADGSDSPAVAAAEVRLADTFAGQGRDSEADARYRDALGRLERANGAHHWSLADGLLGLADLARRGGRRVEAEQVLLRAMGNADMAGRTDVTNRVREALLDLYLSEGRYADAVPLSEALVRTQEAGTATDRAHALLLLERHADVLERAGRAEEAARHRRRAGILRAALEKAATAMPNRGEPPA